MIFKNIIKTLAIALVFCFSSGISFAQATGIMNLSVIEKNEPYVEISGIPLATQWGGYDEDYATLSLPFNIYYDGQVFNAGDDFYVSTNGTCGFNMGWALSSPWWNENIFSPFGGDLDADAVPDPLTYAITGVAPNRTLTIQWKGFRQWASAGNEMNFQVIIEESSVAGTDNKISFKYGVMDPTGLNTWNSYNIGFSGSTTDRIINIEPAVSNSNVYYSEEPNAAGTPANYNTNSFFTSAAMDAISGLGKKYTLAKPNPEFVSVTPTAGTIFKVGLPIPNAAQPTMTLKRSPGQPNVTLTYKIEGPTTAVNKTKIYEATDVFGSNNIVLSTETGEPFTYDFVNATGSAANILPGGAADGNINLSNGNFPGGTYLVSYSFSVEGKPELTKQASYEVILALQNDIAFSGVSSPASKEFMQYPYGASSIPVEMFVRNIGLNKVGKIKSNIQIFFENETIPTYTDTFTWVVDLNPMTPISLQIDSLATGQAAMMKFKNFQPTKIGNYKIVSTCELLDLNKLDNDVSNNAFPQIGNYQFEVINLYDVVSSTIIAPSATGAYFVKYPITPKVEFVNNGASDEVDLPATIKIFDSNNNLVWTRTQIVPSIVRIKGTTYKNLFTFDDAFVPQASGAYRVEVSIVEPNDAVPTNNTISGTFVVSPGLSGTYTIGALGANYPTIESAVKDLYKKGVAGPVTFELIDNNYNVGNIANPNPALDFRSTIVGVNSSNTITFKPSNSAYSTTKGGITIRLNSASGIGCMFGQSTQNGNIEAPINNVHSKEMKKAYSGNEGYITFDGGTQKAFKFIVDAPVDQAFRTAFYMSEGSKFITIKNVNISGLNANPSYATSLPLVYLNGYDFSFDNDERPSGTYSSGVIVRATAPIEPKVGTNYYSLDTLPCNNIVINNNDITGFGFGIVSIGMGPLMVTGSDTYAAFYNTNNYYKNNTIYNVARSGFFLGFEDNTKVESNRIYNLTSPNLDLNGIIAGGEASSTSFGYNNTNLYISANEISGLNSTQDVYGIKLEQYPLVIPGSIAVTFPKVADANKIINNAIYDINSNSLTASKYGIRLFTSRANTYSDLVRPAYFSNNDKVINNTVVLPANTVAGAQINGIVAGIALQNTKNATSNNNLVTVLDNTLTQKLNSVSALLIQGQKTNLNSNRNSLYVTSNNNVNPELRTSLIRFIETDNNSAIVNYGYNAQFEALDQWQNYTAMDMSSLAYNGMNDMMLVGANPPSLKVKNPIPFNSKLNNRGERIESVTTDLLGNARGVANQRYDIGAIEFNGGMFTNDLEVVKINAPANYIYKFEPVTDPSAPMVSTKYNDAEYIMTKAPVEVSARIRNNGSLAQTNREVTVTIKREDNTGGFTIPVLTAKANVTISSTEETNVNFNLADGVGDEFRPMTYAQLISSNYNVPSHFKSMRSNVTPRHQITVTLGTDEALTNNKNIFDKVVRFYIKGSKLNLLISAENSHMDSNFVTNTYNLSTNADTLNKIAGKLNADTLLRNFGDLALRLNYSENSQDLDLLERLGWEPHSINYSLYRSLLWSDGNDNTMTELERKDIQTYLASASSQNKKNFVVASQELPRLNMDPTSVSFLNNQIHIANNGSRGILSSDEVLGVTLNRNSKAYILATGCSADVKPNTAIVNPFDNGIGLAKIAFYYTNGIGGINDNVMAVSTADVNTNVIYYGADWRHFKDVEAILRGMFDFVDNNGGSIFPIELLDFTAEKVGNNTVAINWTTASEVNSSKFEVERSVVKATGVSEFVKIADMVAKGSSSKATYYGPVVDANVYGGASFTYRLKMIDADGSYKYSEEKTVALDGENGTVSMEAINPNPVTTDATIRFSLTSDANVSLSVYNLEGQLVANLLDGQLTAGSHQATFNASELTSGQYNLVLKTGSASIVKTINVVK